MLKNERGFSLIEALVAMTILLVGILALMMTFSQTIKSNVAAGQRTTAIQLAQEKIELLKPIANVASETENIIRNGTLYNRTVNLQSRADNNPDLTNVIVAVSWGANQSESVQFYTVLRK